MDGFYTDGGHNALGYFTESDLPFYYGLHEHFTLCVNYFCSAMTETYPNRMYLASATSGGITDNSVYGYGVLDYPCILDLLDAAGVSWKIYNLGGVDTLSYPLGDNVFLFFKRYANDNRALKLTQDYLNDAARGTLPNVSFMVPSFINRLDEHPPANVRTGMALQQRTITALMRSPLWKSAAYIHTYDEHGGYFEHVRPPQVDAYGLGMRVPTWVISPYAKQQHLEPTVYEHSSILKFIEKVFDLPTLASVNHRFIEAPQEVRTTKPPTAPSTDRPRPLGMVGTTSATSWSASTSAEPLTRDPRAPAPDLASVIRTQAATSAVAASRVGAGWSSWTPRRSPMIAATAAATMITAIASRTDRVA